MLALSDLEKENRAFRLEVSIEDSKGEPKEAVNIVNKAIHIDKAKIFIVLGTAIVKATIPIIDRENALMFAHTIHPGITKESINLFRVVYISGDDEWRKIADYINNQKDIKNIGILRINVEYGEDSKKALMSFLKPEIQLVFDDTYEIGARDFRSQLTKMKAIKESIDALVLMGYGPEYTRILKQMKELGITAKVLGNVDFVYDFLQKDPNAQGAVFVAPTFSAGEFTPKGQEFYNNYLKEYGKPPSWDVAYAYDTIMVLAKAIEMAHDKDLKNIKDALLGIQNFEGVSGIISVRENRDVETSLIVCTLKDYKVVKIE